MKTMKLGNSDLIVPVIGVGCMRINTLDQAAAETFLRTAVDEGLNFFDHADIYADGACEEQFAKALHMNSSIREKIMIQSKCGIRKGMFDFSKKHILEAVNGSLERLQTDYLDVLLLHRPDALVEPEEVASAFETLKSSGKVRHFGISNQKPMQIELLKKAVKQPLVANQLQLSIAHSNMISNGLNVNIDNDSAIDRDGGVLDYCRLNNITIQPWSPFQYGFFKGVYLDNDKFPELNDTLEKVAEKYGVSKTTVAVAWILRHPAHMQPVVGTMDINRLRACAKASDIYLTRSEWYEIYCAAGNKLP